MIITVVLTMLVAGLIIGTALGLIILCIDRCRRKSTRTLNVKDGITLEYDCSPPGIYESIKTFLDDR